MLDGSLLKKNRLESFVELNFKTKIVRNSSIKRAKTKHTTWVMKTAHLRVLFPF